METDNRENGTTHRSNPSPDTEHAHPSARAHEPYEIRLVLPSWLSPTRLLAPFSLVLLTAFFFGLLQLGVPNVINREGYFHLGFSQLMLAEGIRPSVEWMQSWALEGAFTDTQILLHLIVLPFIALKIDPAFCGKTLTVLLDLVFCASLYAWLSLFRVRWSFGFTALMLTASPRFVVRLCELDSTILIFIEILLLLYALEKRRGWLLFSIGWVAVYTSQAFLLLPLMAMLFALFETLQKREKGAWFALFVPVAVGCAVGLVINPYFPSNLIFQRRELVDPVLGSLGQIAVMPQSGTIDTSRFLTAIILPLVLLGCAGLVSLRARPVFDPLLSTLYFSTAFLFLAALKWLWALDYFVFLSVILSALMVSRATELDQKRPSRAALNKIALGVLLFVMLPLVVIHLKVASRSVKQSAFTIRPEAYRTVSNWLRDHTRAGERVIADREDIPLLFFYNQRNHYPFGMKPTDRSASKQSLYLVYRVLIEGMLSDPQVFLDKLKARYLVITSTHHLDKRRRLLQRIRSNDAFEQLFTTRLARVYGLKTGSRLGRSKR